MIRGLQQCMGDSVTFTEPLGGLNESIKRGVLFVPGSVYGSDQGFIRISYARPQLDEIHSGLAHINDALQLHFK
ncbi:hypothetical protein BC351_24095 [Paenibacillus ferrarius]|uniref:Uncharacterized protein n=1 Tax=Paenibacillus ferrarius TaxID=1469647 RepID=A0A1V4HN58_9BACL|nr:hypothetical protein [Paenibacillus ferrarius]OPH58433.1 hypothetical protein BC351_24095 [Paenibacillus ferrarius]